MYVVLNLQSDFCNKVKQEGNKNIVYGNVKTLAKFQQRD